MGFFFGGGGEGAGGVLFWSREMGGVGWRLIDLHCELLKA